MKHKVTYTFLYLLSKETRNLAFQYLSVFLLSGSAVMPSLEGCMDVCLINP